MIGMHSLNDAKLVGRTAAAALRPASSATEAFRLPPTGLLPLTGNDFLKEGQTMGLPVAGALAALKAADFASPQPHLTPEPSQLLPLNELDFIPGTVQSKSSETDRLTTEAQKWVAQTFFGTMLKQARNSPFKSELFSGGRGGDAFGSVMDQELADRMARGAGRKLVDGIVRSIQASAAYRKQQVQMPTPERAAPAAQPTPDAAKDSTKNPTGYDFSKVRIHVAPALRG